MSVITNTDKKGRNLKKHSFLVQTVSLL